MKLHFCLLVIGLSIGFINLRNSTATSHPVASVADWPSEFEGRPITAVALSDSEAAFAESFPGSIGVFASLGGRQVILRRADRPTRRLHDSATCLKAAGFVIGDQVVRDGWLCYQAIRGEQVLAVREQITAEVGEGTWTDVSDWFWEAVFRKSAGPWTAVTVLEAG